MTPNALCVYRVELDSGNAIDFNNAELTAVLRYFGFERIDIKQFWADWYAHDEASGVARPESVIAVDVLLKHLCEGVERGDVDAKFEVVDRNLVRLLYRPLKRERAKGASARPTSTQQAFEF